MLYIAFLIEEECLFFCSITPPFFLSRHSANTYGASPMGQALFWALVTQQEPRAGLSSHLVGGEASPVCERPLQTVQAPFLIQRPCAGKSACQVASLPQASLIRRK